MIRSACINNEKQIGAGDAQLHLGTQVAFPPAYTTDKAGKPLLSWRVLILPYLEQQALFKEFHLDEPWDSEHNRTLIAKMPAIYRCPLESAEAARQGKTRYLAPRGPSTIFPGCGADQAQGRHRRDLEHDHGPRGRRRSGRDLDQAR